MADIVEALKNSRNSLLRSEGEDLELLKKIQEMDASSSQKLRMLLKIAIVDVVIQTGKRHICTCNEALVKTFSSIRDPETSVSKSKNGLFKSKKDAIVLAWDLVQSKYISIVKWELLNFFTFKDSNAKPIHDLLEDVLKKPKQ